MVELCIESSSTSHWRGDLSASFKGEDAIDEGGVSDELFILLGFYFSNWLVLTQEVKGLFGNDGGLFTTIYEGSTKMHPAPSSTVLFMVCSDACSASVGSQEGKIQRTKRGSQRTSEEECLSRRIGQKGMSQACC